MQLSLFDMPVLRAINQSGTTRAAYGEVARSFGLSQVELDKQISWGGREGQTTSYWKRRIRWVMQDLKRDGLIERGREQGRWIVTRRGKFVLEQAPARSLNLAFTTDKGMAFFGDAMELSKHFKGEVQTIVTSPPYFLTKPREYGNLGASEQEHVDKLVEIIEAVLPMLTESGSLFLNLGDTQLKDSHGEASLTNEMLLIELRKRLGLKLMQKLYWHNPLKPSTGHQVTKTKTHRKNVIENVYWLALNPQKVTACTDRVLQPYSESFKKEIERTERRKMLGFETGRVERPSGISSNPLTHNVDRGGAIPSNLLVYQHEAWQSAYSQAVAKEGLPRHPACFPVQLAEDLIRWSTHPGQLVADPFAGSLATAVAAELNDRYWVASEWIKQYLQGGACRLLANGIQVHDSGLFC